MKTFYNDETYHNNLHGIFYKQLILKRLIETINIVISRTCIALAFSDGGGRGDRKSSVPGS